MGTIIWVVTIAAYAASAVVLARSMGPAAGIGLFAVVTACLTLLAGGLLRGMANNTVSWKNYLAGLFLPWTRIVGGGALRSLLLKNELASLAFGVAVVGCDHLHLWGTIASNHQTETGEPTSWLEISLRWSTVLCWFLILGAWSWMLRSLLKGQFDLISVLVGKRGNWIPLLLPPLAVATSIALQAAGKNWLSLMVVGIPLLVVLFPVLMMSLVILYHYLTGKPLRWN